MLKVSCLIRTVILFLCVIITSAKKGHLAIMAFIYRSDFCCELRADGGTYVVLNFKLAKETICSWGKSDNLKSFQFLDSLNVVT